MKLNNVLFGIIVLFTSTFMYAEESCECVPDTSRAYQSIEDEAAEHCAMKHNKGTSEYSTCVADYIRTEGDSFNMDD